MLLLDEPATHLDVRHQLHLFRVLDDVRQRGVAVLAVIHDLPRAAAWAPRMALLDAGPDRGRGLAGRGAGERGGRAGLRRRDPRGAGRRRSRKALAFRGAGVSPARRAGPPARL